MLGTLAVVSLAATAASGFRNVRQWNAYHRAQVSRAKLVNSVATTLILAGATVALFLGRGLF